MIWLEIRLIFAIALTFWALYQLKIMNEILRLVAEYILSSNAYLSVKIPVFRFEVYYGDGNANTIDDKGCTEATKTKKTVIDHNLRGDNSRSEKDPCVC